MDGRVFLAVDVHLPLCSRWEFGPKQPCKALGWGLQWEMGVACHLCPTADAFLWWHRAVLLMYC